MSRDREIERLRLPHAVRRRRGDWSPIRAMAAGLLAMEGLSCDEHGLGILEALARWGGDEAPSYNQVGALLAIRDLNVRLAEVGGFSCWLLLEGVWRLRDDLSEVAAERVEALYARALETRERLSWRGWRINLPHRDAWWLHARARELGVVETDTEDAA